MSELVDVNWDAGCQEIIRAIVIMNANYRLRHTVHTGDLYSFLINVENQEMKYHTSG